MENITDTVKQVIPQVKVAEIESRDAVRIMGFLTLGAALVAGMHYDYKEEQLPYQNNKKNTVSI